MPSIFLLCQLSDEMSSSLQYLSVNLQHDIPSLQISSNEESISGCFNTLKIILIFLRLKTVQFLTDGGRFEHTTESTIFDIDLKLCTGGKKQIQAPPGGLTTH